MRSLLAALTIMLLSLCLTACGSTSKHTGSASQTVFTSATSPGSPATAVPSPAPNQRYLNDGDAEKVDDHDNDNRIPGHEDHDGDSSEEYEETYDNGSYHDSDDSGIVTYGHAANPAEKRTIVAAIKRYYQAAAAEDGATACSMMASSAAKAIPEEYGHGSAGPSYLRAGKTCQAVMSLLFKHSHSHLIAMVAVTGVRVGGNQARALLGSRTMPAGDIMLTRERGVWKIDALLGSPLP